MNSAAPSPGRRRARLTRLFSSGPLAAFRRRLSQNRPKIFLYHQVSPAVFSGHLEFLSSRYQLVPLHNVEQAYHADKPLPPDSAAITFDDGWRSNYDLLPVIEAFGCPVTIFLAMGLVGTHRRIWNTLVSRRENFQLQNMEDRDRLAALQAGYGYSPDKAFETRHMLNDQELDEMAALVDFQSHGMFHPVLPRCSTETLHSELSDSKNKLEDRFQKPVFAFAYPHGQAGPRETRAAREAGYRLARMSGHLPGAADLDKDPMLLPAVGVRDGMPVNRLRDEIIWGELRTIFGRSHRQRQTSSGRRG